VLKHQFYMDWNTSNIVPEEEGNVITITPAMHLVNPKTYVSYGQWVRDVWQPLVELPMLFGLAPQNMTWLQGPAPFKSNLQLVSSHYYNLISNISPVRWDTLTARIQGPKKPATMGTPF
jgi:hypothetical protein